MGCRQSRLYYVDDSVKLARRKDARLRKEYQQEQLLAQEQQLDVDRTVGTQKSAADDCDAAPLVAEDTANAGPGPLQQ